tara:strand:+ start:29 stop:2071 length:2043 start_codon:yes stop_codon:yes gene_type:complete
MSILSSLLGLGQGQPTQVIPTAVTEPTIAKEIAPFLKDILGKGQALYKQRMDEGFVPYEGQTLADVTAQQKRAQEGIAGLVGTQKPLFDEAGVLVRGGTEKATAEALQPYMNPYQQAVTDIAKRDAQERFEQTTLPGLRKQAIDVGAFGGSRAAMRESQAQDAQARLLADIQAKGDLAAFQNAQQQFAAQKQREAQTAEGLTGLGTAQYGAQLKELGQLEAVGREEQQRQQQLLDESYKRFLQERQFPEQQIGQYQQIVAGVPIQQSSITKTPQQFQPSPIAQAIGTGTGLANIYGAFSGNPNFNPIPYSPKQVASGGQVIAAETGGGLSSLPVIKKIRGRQVGEPKGLLEATGIQKILEDIVLTPEEKLVREEKKSGKESVEEAINAFDDDTPITAGDTEDTATSINFNEAPTTPAGVTGESYQESTPTETETGTDLDKTSLLQRYLAEFLTPSTTTTLLKPAFKSKRKALEVDKEQRDKLFDFAKEQAAFNRRQAALAGVTEGLLSPKVGRGGIFADIQGGLLGATKALEGTVAENKELFNMMKDMAAEDRKAALDIAQTNIEELLATNQISQQEAAVRMSGLSTMIELEKLGVDLNDELLTDYIAINDELAYKSPEELEGLRSSIIAKFKRSPDLLKLILNQMNKYISAGGGPLQNVTIAEKKGINLEDDNVEIKKN